MLSLSHHIHKLLHRLRDERAFATLPAFMAVIVGSSLSLAAWAAAHGDVKLQDRDRWSKVAYTKAQSGVTDYVQRMAEDSSFWQFCDQPSGTNDADGIDHALNDADIGTSGHLNRRWWPTPTNLSENTALSGQYTIDLMPANGYATCKSNGNRALTMVDETTGAIRVRVTGRAGPAVPNTPTINPDPAAPNTFVARTASSINTWRQKRWKHRSIVVEFRRKGFLDYAYFTDREGLEPMFYTNATTRAQLFELLARLGHDARSRQLLGLHRDPVRGRRPVARSVPHQRQRAAPELQLLDVGEVRQRQQGRPDRSLRLRPGRPRIPCRERTLLQRAGHAAAPERSSPSATTAAISTCRNPTTT